MTPNFSITGLEANDILIYDEITESFINSPKESILPNDYITGGINLGTGQRILNDTSGNTLRFKTLVGTNGINISDFGNNVTIAFDGNAQKLQNLGPDDFIKVNDPFSEINVENGRFNLNVYSKDESHDQFMETNASNIPDVDNLYDLGSNGRRYADIYAYTFHGTATNAIKAQNLTSNGAVDGDVLIWSDDLEKWAPESISKFKISGAQDVDISRIDDGSVLVYSTNRMRWEAQDSAFLGGDSTSGAFTEMENIGSGFALYSYRLGNVAKMRTLGEGDNISLSYNFNDEEITINAEVPQTTDELSEGSSNFYLTDERFLSQLNDAELKTIGDVQEGNPGLNQGLVWNGSEWSFRNVSLDINDTDDIPEGDVNLFLTRSRAYSMIEDYIGDSSFGITMNDLLDTNVSTANNSFIYYNESNSVWENKFITVSDLDDMNLSSLSDGHTLYYNESLGRFNTRILPTNLSQLNETTTIKHFTISNLQELLGEATTEDLPDTSNKRYLTETNLGSMNASISIDTLKDVDISSVSDGNMLIWDGDNQTFIPGSSEDLDITVNLSTFDLNDVQGVSTDLEDGDWLVWNQSQESFIGSKPFSRLQSLEDVQISSLSDNDSIIYKGGVFVNTPSVPYNNINSYVDGHLVVYSTTEGCYVNANADDITYVELNITSLNDINITDIQTEDILAWDNVNNEFTNYNISDILELNITSLNDINITDIQTEDILVWDNVNNEFTNYNISDILELQGVGNVSVDDLSLGATTVYDVDTEKFLIRPLNIEDLGNVDNTSTLIDGNSYALSWNETNSTFSFSSTPSISNEEIDDQNILVFDVVDSVFKPSTIWNALGVTYSNPSQSNVFVYDSDALSYTVRSLSIDDLDGIDTENPQDGSALLYRESSDNFVFSSMSMQDLGDILFNVSSMEDNAFYSLRWNSTSENFRLRTPEIKDIGDVEVPDPLEEISYVLSWSDIVLGETEGTVVSPAQYVLTSNPTFKNIGYIYNNIDTPLEDDETVSTVALDSSTGKIKNITITNDTEITLSSPDDDYYHEMKLIISDGDSYDITWMNDNIEWVSASEPTLTSKDMIEFITLDGTNWIGNYIGTIG